MLFSENLCEISVDDFLNGVVPLHEIFPTVCDGADVLENKFAGGGVTFAGFENSCDLFFNGSGIESLVCNECGVGLV